MANALGSMLQADVAAVADAPAADLNATALYANASAAAEAGSGDDGAVVDTTMADSLVAAAATLSQAMAVELLPGEAPVSVVSPAGIAIKTGSLRRRR